MALAKLAPFFCAAAFTALAPAQETQFVATATSTHFAALNPNAFTVLMVLGDVEHGARTQMLLAPGASFETGFPSGTLEGIYIEVVFYSSLGRVTSGAVSFDSMIGFDADAIEVSLNGLTADAWICTNGTRLPADSGVNLVPETLLNCTAPPTEPLLLDPTHVPIITPTDLEGDNTAPKIHPNNPPV